MVSVFDEDGDEFHLYVTNLSADDYSTSDIAALWGVLEGRALIQGTIISYCPRRNRSNRPLHNRDVDHQDRYIADD